MIKNIAKIIAIFMIGIVGGIFAEQIIWPYLVEKPLFEKYELENRPVLLTETIIIQENTAIVEAIEKVERSVIGIKTQLKTGKTIEGSGLAITSDGLIVTLAEIVPQGETFTFHIDGELTCGYSTINIGGNLTIGGILNKGTSILNFNGG